MAAFFFGGGGSKFLEKERQDSGGFANDSTPNRINRFKKKILSIAGDIIEIKLYMKVKQCRCSSLEEFNSSVNHF